MIPLFHRVARPGSPAEETTWRRSLALPPLQKPQSDPARLQRISDQALRTIRTARRPEPDFGFLLAPRVAALLLAMMIAGGAAGFGLPDTTVAPAATPELTTLLDQPLTLAPQ